jgi:hypothetical protein
MPASGATVPRGTIGMRFSLAKGLFHVEHVEHYTTNVLSLHFTANLEGLLKLFRLAVRVKSHFLTDLGSVRKLHDYCLSGWLQIEMNGFTPEIPQP